LNMFLFKFELANFGPKKVVGSRMVIIVVTRVLWM